MDTWKLQDAKARFSQLVERALVDGPQIVTRHGTNAVVVLSYREFEQTRRAKGFKAFLLSSQGVSDLPLTRDEHPSRENDFEVPA